MMNSYDDIKKDYTVIMTKDIAQDIRQWRVDEDCSWRKVHTNFQEKYVDPSEWSVNEEMVKHFGVIPTANQLVGMVLCEVAMEYLNENTWNE